MGFLIKNVIIINNDNTLLSTNLVYYNVFLMKGTIKKFLSQRGYGFIEVKDEEKDIFFHVSSFPVSSLPTSGQNVEFTITESPKGKEATGLRVIDNMGDGSNLFIEEEPIQSIQTELIVKTRSLNELDGVGPKYQELLHASGFNFVKDLAEETPSALFKKLNIANHKNVITRKPPTLENVQSWITLAKV